MGGDGGRSLAVWMQKVGVMGRSWKQWAGRTRALWGNKGCCGGKWGIVAV